jgi:hypothetical protein
MEIDILVLGLEITGNITTFSLETQIAMVVIHEYYTQCLV